MIGTTNGGSGVSYNEWRRGNQTQGQDGSIKFLTDGWVSHTDPSNPDKIISYSQTISPSGFIMLENETPLISLYVPNDIYGTSLDQLVDSFEMISRIETGTNSLTAWCQSTDYEGACRCPQIDVPVLVKGF